MFRARAVIRLLPHLQPACLDGLEAYSHAWVVFHFHRNTTRTAGSFRARIAPPKAGGARVGVLSTRSPHRPNPVGLTLVRLVRVEGRDLFVEGGDMVDGTPVLDIKPYVPHYDSVPWARVPDWVDEAQRRALVPVVLSAAARGQLRRLAPLCKHYEDARELEHAVCGMLSLDIHSGSTAARKAKQGAADGRLGRTWWVPFDELDLACVTRRVQLRRVSGAEEAGAGAGGLDCGGEASSTVDLIVVRQALLRSERGSLPQPPPHV